MPSPKMICLKSSDGESFYVLESVAFVSRTIKLLIEDGCTETTIPLPDVTSKILAKVIEYCKRHAEGSLTSDEDLKAFDAEFVKVDKHTLFDMMSAAIYLNIKSLRDLTVETADDMVKAMTAEEICEFYDIEEEEGEEV